ncbi:MAG TPA: hypothetical protein VM597_18995 [Gemmataceae bacterium]|jgi:hypothetical protein|nr:hypothetical protein [Gemmataceae bacterium]
MNDTMFGWAAAATMLVGIGLALEFALRGPADRYGTPQRAVLDTPDRPGW